MNAGPSKRRIRVLTVDDHPVLRDGIAAILVGEPDMELAGEASDGLEALKSFRDLRPDVVLMDVQMPGMDGIDALAAIRADWPQAKVIILTTYAGDAPAARALKGGAAGYLLKSALRTELLETIRAVHAGRRHIAPDIASNVALHSGEDQLSAREVEVLRLVAGGQANKEIAWRLGVTEDTIKAHLKNIFQKLRVADRTHAATLAMQRGII